MSEETLVRLANAVELLVEQNCRRELAEQRARTERQLAESGALLRPPPRFGLPGYVAAIPGLAALFTGRVPDEFVAQEGAAHIVACPCGESPAVRPGELTSCDCGRWFLFDGSSVRVALGPKSEVRDGTGIDDSGGLGCAVEGVDGADG